MVVAYFFFPGGKFTRKTGKDVLSCVELEAMALPVVEAYGFDARVPLERPREAGGGILPAGE
jgi:hypothetical protein